MSLPYVTALSFAWFKKVAASALNLVRWFAIVQLTSRSIMVNRRSSSVFSLTTCPLVVKMLFAATFLLYTFLFSSLGRSSDVFWMTIRPLVVRSSGVFWMTIRPLVVRSSGVFWMTIRPLVVRSSGVFWMTIRPLMVRSSGVFSLVLEKELITVTRSDHIIQIMS